MSFGSVGTGLGPPVGGATSAYGSDSSSWAPQACGGSLFDYGSTLNANLLLSGVGHILEGAGELLQAAALDGGYVPPDPGTGCPCNTNDTGTTNTTTGSASDDQSLYGNQGGDGGTTGGNGLDDLLQFIGGGNQGNTGDLDSMLNELYKMVGNGGGQTQDPVGGFQPQPQTDPVADLVNRANVDPQLQGVVTQIAQDPVGGLLLKGAVDGGLTGIGVANLEPGFFGQTLPLTREVQIGTATVQQGNDLVRTVAHELLHAATLPDGDSIREEKLADQVGTEVQRRITGQPPGYTLGGDSYNNLPQDNGIINSLLKLGITFQG